ncbi:hypothetical protein U5801_11915 [Lamprobacter modestohalophilus]|uniref:hypothetical protein n=1 Tax=Lamprobacter modestohalophilus TaxID=1064514 RepID=UPI002ADEC9B6|nr:hypothetical protein [Lamprobacter modestohalophilus]MEA1050511.1 hypothetical protein [Lamprobacter modestohalophilus]
MIDLELYKPHPEKPGYLAFDRCATVEEVKAQCDEALNKAGLLEELDYFSIASLDARGDKPWPRARWVACFPVVGGSEGHYIHVEAIALMGDPGQTQTGERQLVLIGKTFLGLEHALAVSGTLTRAFHGRG